MWLSPAVLAALVITALALPSLASAGESAGWQAYQARDYERAARLWQRDAKRGEPNALFGLGLLAEREGDEGAAAGWYEKAARAGLAAAQVLIADRYISGWGVAADPVTAYAWLSRAIAAGVPNAAAIRDQLAQGMTADAMRQAEALTETLVTK